MKQSPELRIIQENMLTGSMAAYGFLGDDTRSLADILRDDQCIGRGGGINGAGCEGQGERGCQKGSAEELHVRFSLGVTFLRTGLELPVLDFARAGRGRAVERKSASVPVHRRRAGRSVWFDQE